MTTDALRDTTGRVHLSVAEARALSEQGRGSRPTRRDPAVRRAQGLRAGARDARARRDYLFIAFKPDLFVPLEDYRRALGAEIAAVKATPRQEGVDEIRIPGERAYRERARLSREGLEIDCTRSSPP
jgi:hypothetical protein